MAVSIWMEGYAATGESGTAQCIGTYPVDTLDEAVEAYMKEHPNSVDVRPDRPQKYAIWGCRLFDNEQEARKSFG